MMNEKLKQSYSLETPVNRLTNQTEISEIFSSIQGEGPYLGTKQIFVRFGRCNMHCVYCDEIHKMQSGAYKLLSHQEVIKQIDELEMSSGPHDSISLTGGEPLFYAPFLKNFLPVLKEKGFKTYLETNGTLTKALENVIRWCDIIAMDMKPPTSTKDRDFYTIHEEFLKAALKKEVFVKVVVTAATHHDEVLKCAEIVSRVNPRIAFILQPETDATGPNKAVMENIQNHLLYQVKSMLSDVRVIGQMHKVWGVR